MGWTGAIDMSGMLSNRLRNKTLTFNKFLLLDTLNNRVGKEFSFVGSIYGSTGSGKSALWSIIANKLLENNPRRWVAFWKASKEFVDTINDNVPKALKGRFTSVNHILELDKAQEQGFPEDSCIFIVDEADMDTNAKQALEKESISLEKMVKKSRHIKMITLLASQTGGFLKQIRMTSHFSFYKQCGQRFIAESKDFFAKRFSWELGQLAIEKVIFLANHKYFTTKTDYLMELKEDKDPESNKMGKRILQGTLNLPLTDNADWFSGEISQHYSNESIDHDYELELRKENQLEKLAKKMVESMGSDLFKAKAFMLATAWLKDTYPEDYYMFKPDLKKIYGDACYLIYKQSKAQAIEDKESQSSVNAESIAKDGLSFAGFVKEYYAKLKEDLKAEICYGILSGYTQGNMADKLKFSDGKINAEFKEVREKDIGYLSEIWSGEKYRLLILGGNSPYPDAIHEKTGNIVTIKFRYDSRKKANINWDLELDFNPAYTLARELDTPFYILQIYPQWNQNMIKIAKVHPMEKVVVIRQDTPNIDLDKEPINKKMREILDEKGKNGIQLYYDRLKARV